MSTKQEEIGKLRNRLLELGTPILIPARDWKQPESASDDEPVDITLYPYFQSLED